VTPDHGVGLACGTEKNSVVAACVEVRLGRAMGGSRSRRSARPSSAAHPEPANLLSQVRVHRHGPRGALTEELEFRTGES